MKVYIDGQERADITGDSQAIWGEVQSRAGKEGRVVIEIRLDDVVMDEKAFLNVSGGMAVHFKTQPVRGLVLESLDEAIQYIPRLAKGLEEIALHFENNEFSLGEGKLADGADGLDWLLQVFQKCNSLLAVSDADNASLNEMQSNLAGAIASLGELHSEKKYLRMALDIRQKLVPEVEKFSMHVKKLRSQASSIQ